MPRLTRYGVGQKLKCGARKSVHVGEPVGTAGLKRHSPFDDPGDGKTGMASRIAVAITRRSGRAGFTQAPGCAEARFDAARQHQRVRLGRRPKLPQCSLVQREQRLFGLAGIGDRATEEIRRRAGDREQRRRDQSAGRGLGDGDGFAPRLEARGYGLGQRYQIVHGVIPGCYVQVSEAL
jgi:hypothetical protein